MLLLMFRSGPSLYAFDARRVAEVVPRVPVRPLPHAPAYIDGLLSYRGRAVPVIDFGVLVGAAPARPALSSRVVLTAFTTHEGRERLVGVVAESVSRVSRVEGGEVVSPAMSLDEAPYLGSVLQLDGGLVQMVAADKLLSPRMQDALYGSDPDPDPDRGGGEDHGHAGPG